MVGFGVLLGITYLLIAWSDVIAMAPPAVSLGLPFVVAICSAWWHTARTSQLAKVFSAPQMFGVSVLVMAAGLVLSISGISLGIVMATLAGLVLGSTKSAIGATAFRRHITKILTGSPDGDFGGEMRQRVRDMFKDSPNPLLAGKLEDAAKARWSQEKYPYLYEDVPEDIEAPVVVDGRCVTGERLTYLVPRRLSSRTVEQCYEVSLDRTSRKALIIATVAVLVAITAGYSIWKSGATSATKDFRETAQRSVTVEEVVKFRSDVWNPADIKRTINELDEDRKARAGRSAVAGKTALIITTAIGTIGALICFLIFAYSYFVYEALRPARIKRVVNNVINTEKNLRTETTEGLRRWKYRMDERELYLLGYRLQVEEAKLGRNEYMLDLGEGTGTFLFRGMLRGYKPKQRIRLSFFRDLHAGLIALGGIGSGKSYMVAGRVFRSAINAMKAMKLSHTLSMFVTCSKGVLWMDAKKLADENQIEFRTIGAQAGEFGVDLFDGLTPNVVADTLNEALAQTVGSSGGDSPIWGQTAQAMIEAAANVAYVWEITRDGQAYVKEKGERIYSPVGIYSLIRSLKQPDGLLSRAIDAICDDVDEDLDQVASLVSPSFWSEVRYLRVELPQTAEVTLDGFISNVNFMMQSFVKQNHIRKQFGTGKSDHILDISRLWDDRTITGVNIGPEYGAAGRLINTFVKIRMYHMSELRQKTIPNVQYKSKLVVVIDECQDLVTSEGHYSDASYWARGRSTGSIGILLTQGVSGLSMAFREQAQGPKTQKLLNCFRSKLCLASEDPETHRYFRELLGEVTRYPAVDDDEYETFAAMRRELGHWDVDFDVIQPFDFTNQELSEMFDGTVPEHIRAEALPMVKADMQYVAADFGGAASIGKAPAVDWIEKMKSVAWRAEDKRTARLRDPGVKEHLYRGASEHLGRGIAVFVTTVRENETRADVIDMNR